jgi:hypothetical protein
VIIALPATAAALSLSAPTAAKAVERMMKPGMPRATAGRRRHHPSACYRYPAILDHDTEPLPPRPEASRTESITARLAP